MARPRKRRRVCMMPHCTSFGPEDGLPDETVRMTVDEYETIRLIDLEGLTQEQCADQMEVARTTAQAIYASARKKLAECIVEGLTLIIEGGDYILCEHLNGGCGNGCCRKHRDRQWLNRRYQMKIAVTYEDGNVFQHFGHSEYFRIYDVEDGKVIDANTISTDGSGHGALAGILKGHGVDTLICGGIGGGAKNALAEAGISLYGGVSGSADQAVENLLAKKLDYNPDVECSHHGEDHHGSCGGHDGECGHHH